ncbi:hypothetical protein Sfulv_30560 [Streptomyces fulvorobeus]|uniref:Uncharacterized protein n=1 Tax=Streptomyces fulvorobeus TaxID=284028 RepID=A0A7J0C6T2_9ACTN|nr:hypothetical protein Sfulv_30560 [Streptomyces fulvorobeus]
MGVDEPLFGEGGQEFVQIAVDVTDHVEGAPPRPGGRPLPGEGRAPGLSSRLITGRSRSVGV